MIGLGQLEGASRVPGKISFLDLSDGVKGI